MSIDENRIPFLPGSLNQKLNVPFPVDFQITEEERKHCVNVYDFPSIEVVETITGNKDCYLIRFDLTAVVDLVDSHDPDRIDEIEVSDSVEITLLPGDDENSDIQPDQDGIYDLRGPILALLYSCIPENYSEVELKKVDGFPVYSESEYQKEKKKKNSPFALLDSDDF